jgi:glutathione S-transferase
MSTKILKLYGVPLSQPFCSVAWTMLQLGVPFDIELAVPGMSNKMGTKHENFQSLTPHRSTQVPLLMCDDSLVISESPAIMAHLCERHGDNRLYAASGSTDKALIDSYMHWHHTNTRFLAKIFQTKVRPDLKREITEEDQDRMQEVFESFDSGWLKTNKFIAGMETPTIADILAYGEISTVTMTNLVSIDDYDHLKAWTQRLAQLPYHKEAHTALEVLGDLTDASTPIAKRLGAATKDGLKALKEAQADVVPSSRL